MIKIIYTIFLGLLLAIFVGAGVFAFYPSPKAPDYPSILSAPATQSTDSPELRNTQRQFDQDQKVYQGKLAVHNRNASIITIIAAIVMLIISLVFLTKLDILSDGLLLGGVLTLLYSVGLSFTTDDSRYRFLAVTIGLVVALILGYVKFILPERNR